MMTADRRCLLLLFLCAALCIASCTDETDGGSDESSDDSTDDTSDDSADDVGDDTDDDTGDDTSDDTVETSPCFDTLSDLYNRCGFEEIFGRTLEEAVAACEGGDNFFICVEACAGDTSDCGEIQDCIINECSESAFLLTVIDYQTRIAVSDATVELLNDETGEPFDPPFAFTSDENGEVIVMVPEGFESTAVRASKDHCMTTVRYHFALDADEGAMPLVSESTAHLMALTLEEDIDEATSLLLGAFYWGDAGEPESIGCSKVTIEPSGGAEVHYFGIDGLPTLTRDITDGFTPANEQGTNPNDASWGDPLSRFIAFNQPTDSGIQLTSTVYDVQLTGTAVGSAITAVPKLFANTVVIVDTYFDSDAYPTNPTPNWCVD